MPALEFARRPCATGQRHRNHDKGKTCRAPPRGFAKAFRVKSQASTRDACLTGHSSLNTDTDRQVGMNTARAHTSDPA